MHDSSNGLKRLTLVLSIVIVSCLSVAALGGLFETPLLVYFWYFALLGIAAMVVLSALLAVSRLLGVVSRRYHRILLYWGDGVPGH